LHFNTTKKDKEIKLDFRENDFSKKIPHPKKMKMILKVPARTIVEIPLVTE